MEPGSWNELRKGTLEVVFSDPSFASLIIPYEDTVEEADPIMAWVKESKAISE